MVSNDFFSKKRKNHLFFSTILGSGSLDIKDEMNRKIELVKEHMTNMENIIFSPPHHHGHVVPGHVSEEKDTAVRMRGNAVVLQWKLCNYQQHYLLGDEVQFFTACLSSAESLNFPPR